MKRSVDLFGSILGLLALSPAMLLVAIMVRMSLGPSVLFVQTRPGLYGKPFRLIKFRTMRNSTEPNGVPLPDHQRITRVGQFLRASSLDELPELWNVLKGDMSLVGPRPLLMEYMPLYSTHQARRHEVRPGITGWAQVNGRTSISWPEKFDFDVWYADNKSLWLDLRILFMTIGRVVSRHGTTTPQEGVETKFSGND